jgi:putative endonuclease
MFNVYVLKSEKTSRRYVGSCTDLHERLRRHNLGHSKATRHSIPWTLIYNESFSNRADAAKGNDITKQVEAAMNLIDDSGRTVAAATGRGFESRRPDKFLPRIYTDERRLSVANKSFA